MALVELKVIRCLDWTEKEQKSVFIPLYISITFYAYNDLQET